MIDLLFCLTVFGIVYIVRYTDGPFDTLFHFKRLIGLYIPDREWKCETNEDGISGTIEWTALRWIENPKPTSFLAKLVNCFACLSTWIALVSSVGYILLGFHTWNSLPFLWFGATGFSIFLFEVILIGYGESH